MEPSNTEQRAYQDELRCVRKRSGFLRQFYFHGYLRAHTDERREDAFGRCRAHALIERAVSNLLDAAPEPTQYPTAPTGG